VDWKQLDSYLSFFTYVGGDEVGKVDNVVLSFLKGHHSHGLDKNEFPNVTRWYRHINEAFTEKDRNRW
jgi:glutathione S-transferase